MKIKLPMNKTFSTNPISLTDIQSDPNQNSLNTLIRFETMDFAKANDAMNVVYRNSNEIIQATISIEHQMNQILLDYFFRPDVSRHPSQSFFLHNILESSEITFAFKRKLLENIINTTNYLSGQEKNKLFKNLNKIMTWRNAFAHGKLHFNTSSGAQLDYYKGTQQQQILTDDFWKEVERSYTETYHQLPKLKNKIREQWISENTP